MILAFCGISVLGGFALSIFSCDASRDTDVWHAANNGQRMLGFLILWAVCAFVIFWALIGFQFLCRPLPDVENPLL